MNNKPQNHELERVTYWEGQMLRSSDFLDIQRVEDQRRWWHNRAMHNAFGVYQGFQATAVSATQGHSAVIQVTPGVAYDCFGRELVLECLATVEFSSAPLAPGDVRTLLVRYKKPASRKQTDPVAAVCCFCDGRSSSGNIEFVWSDSPRSSPEEGVPLGVMRTSGAAQGRFSPFLAAPRRRPLARPQLATGSTVPGNTSWQPWDFALPQDPFRRVGLAPIEIGVQTTIDTTAAGFTDLPQYFAWIEGSIWNPQTSQLVPALLPSIANESLTSFTFRLILMRVQSGVIFAEAFAASTAQQMNLVQDSNDFADFAQKQGLYVAWLGCQMPAKQPFVPQSKFACKTNIQPGHERRIR
jgi:hypothetical protein